MGRKNRVYDNFNPSIFQFFNSLLYLCPDFTREPKLMCMKRITVYGILLLMGAMMMACTGNTVKGGGDADSDSVVALTDSVPENFEFEAIEALAGLQTELPPVPLYVRNGMDGGEEIVQVVYWITPDSLAAKEDAAYVDSWTVQQRLIAQKEHYTKMIGPDDKFYDVTYLGEAKSPENEYGSLASTQHPQKGLKFKINDKKAFTKAAKDDYLNSLYWLIPDAYLSHREMLKVKSFPWDQRKSLPADVVKAMEKKYGVQAERSQMTAQVGEDYVAGFIQFKPKGEVVLAVEVLICGDQVWSYSDEGRTDSDDISVWHVDDGGEYFGNNYDAAFIGPDGIELLYTHHAPESADFGWMTIKGDKLVRHEIGGYYVWYD